MSAAERPPEPPVSAGGAAFPSTHWSVLGGDGDAAARARALDGLARGYARPIEAWLGAALGLRREDARDLAQDFFVWSIETRLLEKADPARGRFRAFLKTALRHYAVDALRRGAARKRGGGVAPLSLDAARADEPSFDPADAGATPDALLDRAWRAALVEQALERTRAEFEAAGKGAVFAVFRDWYLEPGAELDQQALAARHGLTRVDVSNYLMRAKRAWRAALRQLVLETVDRSADLEDELRWLAEPDR